MACPACDAPEVQFPVPATLREHAPEGATVAALCTECLGVRAVPEADADESVTADAPPSFDAVHEAFPAGEGGVAFALLCGTLPSLALRKADASALRRAAERAGVDVELAFDRLLAAAEEGALSPSVDLARRRDQLGSLLDRS